MGTIDGKRRICSVRNSRNKSNKNGNCRPLHLLRCSCGRLLKMRGSIMAFNVNCRDCKHYRKGIYENDYCCHPIMIYHNRGVPLIITDLEQNIDCDLFDIR